MNPEPGILHLLQGWKQSHHVSIFSQLFHLFNHSTVSWLPPPPSQLSLHQCGKRKKPSESVPEAPMPSWPTFPLPAVPLFLWTESHDIYASFLLDGFLTSPPHSYAPISSLLSLNAALFTATFSTQSTGFCKWQFLVFSILFLNADYLIRSKTFSCFAWNLLKCNKQCKIM